jgi:hypothetical protein
MYELADYLGQPLSVILDMTVSEYEHWFTFIKLKNDRARKQQSEGSNSIKHQNRVRR